MSYILDALRRAEAQRSRGQVPTLTSQSSGRSDLVSSPEAGTATARWAWPVAGVVLAVLLVAAGSVGWRMAQPAAEPAPVRAAAPATAPASPAPSPSPSPASPLPPTAVVPVVPPPTPTPTPTPTPGPSPARPPAATPSTRATPAALPSRQDLTPAQQRGLPPLVLTGTVYASERRERLAMLNGDLRREGDRVAPELFVDEIRRRDVVLRWKGERFTIAP